MFGGEACNITVVVFSCELVPALQEQKQVRTMRGAAGPVGAVGSCWRAPHTPDRHRQGAADTRGLPTLPCAVTPRI